MPSQAFREGGRVVEGGGGGGVWLADFGLVVLAGLKHDSISL